jgi:23S rRNA pseudouridine1911/1915/1917 synthase
MTWIATIDNVEKHSFRGHSITMTDAGNSATHRTVTVPQDSAGGRLDKWLAGALPETSRTRLRALIAGGAVTIDGAPMLDPTHQVKPGTTFTVHFPKPDDAKPMAQSMDLDFAFEDENLIVVNKPPGLVVHPAPGNPDNTLVNALLAHCGDSLQGIGGVRRPGIVHRIDKNTSGLLVVAKTEKAHAGLAAQFAAHDIDRIYDAFVWGIPLPPQGIITGAIGRNKHNRKKMAIVTRGGKTAETSYATVATFGETAAHMRCTLKTGRTHQIRVHMTSYGHPLIGDATYGSAQTKRLRNFSAAGSGLIRAMSRQALHAATLGFLHPVTGVRLQFECPLPNDLLTLRNVLEKETMKR